MNTTPRPLITATLDVETTGLDPVNDRVIELALLIRSGDVDLGTSVYRFNPMMPISAEATQVHGITDDDVSDQPTFAECREELWSLLHDVAIVRGYNVSFDLQFLAQEFARVGVTWPNPGLIILDGMKIWQHQQPRTLENACRAYAFTPDPDRLHSADYDVEITSKLIDLQLAQADVGEIITATKGIMLDPAGKVALDDKGEAIYTFGKHVGERVLSQRGYAQWMLDKDFAECTKAVLRGLLTDPDYLKNLTITTLEHSDATSVS